MSLEEVRKLTAELHTKLEEKDANNTEAIEKINKDLDKYEEENKKIAQDFVNAKNEAKEHKEKIEALESKLLRFKPTNILEKTAALKSFEKFVTKGMATLDDAEKKYLRTDNDPNGGYLAPSEYVNEIIKKITELTPVRSVARVRQTSKGSIEIPSRATIVSSNWVGEAKPATESNSTYGIESIPVNKLSVYSRATVEMLNDSAFNIETEINADFAEEIARNEGYTFVNGTGINQPEGFMTNASIGSTNSGVANSITGDSLVDVYKDLKTGYNPVYGLNKTTLTTIRKLKDGQGQYLWVPGLAQGMPNSINGKPYIEMPDMPDEDADAYPVIYGDFARGYTIVDGTNMGLIRDIYTLADQGLVRFVLMKRTGGKVVLPEAFQKIKCSV